MRCLNFLLVPLAATLPLDADAEHNGKGDILKPAPIADQTTTPSTGLAKRYPDDAFINGLSRQGTFESLEVPKEAQMLCQALGGAMHCQIFMRECASQQDKKLCVKEKAKEALRKLFTGPGRLCTWQSMAHNPQCSEMAVECAEQNYWGI